MGWAGVNPLAWPVAPDHPEIAIFYCDGLQNALGRLSLIPDRLCFDPFCFETGGRFFQIGAGLLSVSIPHTPHFSAIIIHLPPLLNWIADAHPAVRLH